MPTELAAYTYLALLVTQALHLLHHRLVKRHISFAEVGSSFLLCIPPTGIIPNIALASLHILMITVQIVGSLFIYRLSPDWERSKHV